MLFGLGDRLCITIRSPVYAQENTVLTLFFFVFLDNAAIEAQCLNWLSAKAIFDQITADGLQADEDVSMVSHLFWFAQYICYVKSLRPSHWICIRFNFNFNFSPL